MSETTGIEWTNSTHNFWFGCHKVSAGCKNCYAEREMTKFGRDFKTVVRAKGFDKPLHWKEGRKIFVNSWSDFFIEEADPWRDEAWDIIRRTPQHTYQILTKRPERIPYCLPEAWFPKNVWWGVSIENQDHLDRWSALEGALHYHGGMVWFISAEPLLGPLDLSVILEEIDLGDEDHTWWTRVPDWIIIGGESGPNCRPMNIEWARSIVAQCREAGVACFVKQDSGPRPGMQGRIPDDLWIKEFPEEEN